jgi:excisionase family DNA binding protein
MMPRVTAAVRELEVPDQTTAEQAASAVADLTNFLRAHPTPTARVQLCADDADGETQVVIPSVAFHFFVDVLAEMANGNAVTVAPVHAELTTQQAADILNVSRPYLIKLLDDDRIPHRRVGNRRKVLLVDLLNYKRADDRRRLEVLDDLTRETAELGLDEL